MNRTFKVYIRVANASGATHRITFEVEYITNEVIECLTFPQEYIWVEGMKLGDMLLQMLTNEEKFMISIER